MKVLTFFLAAVLFFFTPLMANKAEAYLCVIVQPFAVESSDQQQLEDLALMSLSVKEGSIISSEVIEVFGDYLWVDPIYSICPYGHQIKAKFSIIYNQGIRKRCYRDVVTVVKKVFNSTTPVAPGYPATRFEYTMEFLRSSPIDPKRCETTTD